MLCFAVLLLATGLRVDTTVTPVQKVIQLMNDMHAKGVQEKQDEEVRFTKFKMWCDGTTSTKSRDIKESNAEIEQLSADIAKAQSDVDELTDDIAGLDMDIAKWDQDKKDASDVRNKERKDYDVTHKDYSESIDALGRALNTMQNQNFDRTQGAALLQKVALLARVPAAAKSALTAFLSQPSKEMDPMTVSAPEANAYEFQSGGVVDMLKNLEEKFEDERADLEKTESNARHAFEMIAQELTDSIEGAESEKSRKSRSKAQRQKDGAEAKGELADTTATRDEDQHYLTDLVSECEQKSSDFTSRQQLRGEELGAITKAIEIISGGSVSGASEKHLPQLVQKDALMQKFMSSGASTAQARVAEFLTARGAALHSRTLSLLATKVAEDPFSKVKKMIKDLVVRLMEEANEEAEHKGWCDTELGTNEIQRKSKQEEVENLQAQADMLNADIAKLGQEVSDLAAAIQEIDAAVAEATSNRATEKTKNEETIADSKAAQVSVTQALQVLKEFYAKAAEATALMQGPAGDDAPETFDTPYTGMGAESGGVIGMLEVIASDFSRLESDTASAEELAANSFTKFSNDSEVDRATKSQDSKNKEKLRTRKTSELGQTNKDLEGTQAELDAALAYYEKLKPSCVDAGVNYEDRVKRREEEIQSLKEALEILSGDDI